MTLSRSILHDLPGGQALFDWFGRVPRFHDAYLLALKLSSAGPSLIRIHGWNMTGEVDADGYFVLDRHVVVTMELDDVSAFDCADYDVMPGIIGDLEIRRVGGRFQIAWDASYGVAGSVTARQVRISLQPGKP